MMDEAGIAEGILSVSSVPRIADPIRVARDCDDAAATLRQLHPGRFGAFASLPLPNIDLFGTDFPMAPDFGLRTFAAAREAIDVPRLSRSAIDRDNAAALLGRSR